MQPPRTTDTPQCNHTGDDAQSVGSPFGPATARLIRWFLYGICLLGGAATGTSIVTLLLYQPTDWRWAWLGAGGLLTVACAVGLSGYFPRPDGNAS